MLKTVEAILEKDGRLRLLEKIGPHTQGVRYLVVVLPVQDENSTEAIEPENDFVVDSLARVSEPFLQNLWNNEEEDHGWTGL